MIIQFKTGLPMILDVKFTGIVDLYYAGNLKPYSTMGGN